MANTTIGGIATSVSTVAGTDIFETEQSGTTKKVTATALATFVNTGMATSASVSSGDAATLASAQSYADSLVVGLFDYRGNYDASANTFPTSANGGSGASGAVLKADVWRISVAGTLGGTAVSVGDLITALIDTPAQTAANWAITSNELGYTPENTANKSTSMSSPDNTKYPTLQLLFDQLALKANLRMSTNTQTGTTYTFVLGDANNQTHSNNASSNTFTIPPVASVAWTINDIIFWRQIGAGQTTFVGGSGVTFRNRHGTLKSLAQYASGAFVYAGSDVWDVTGELAEV